jgi:hypothetical protein
VSRIHVDDAADHEPVEQHAQRHQVLLNGGRGKGFRLVILVLEVLEERGDVERLDVDKLKAVRLAPCGEAPCGVEVSLARVVIVELGGEEIARALLGLGHRHEDRREKQGGAGGGEGMSSVPVMGSSSGSSGSGTGCGSRAVEDSFQPASNACQMSSNE